MANQALIIMKKHSSMLETMSIIWGRRERQRNGLNHIIEVLKMRVHHKELEILCILPSSIKKLLKSIMQKPKDALKRQRNISVKLII